MNPHLTEIAYILDRSGSMQPMQEPAVAAFIPGTIGSDHWRNRW